MKKIILSGLIVAFLMSVVAPGFAKEMKAAAADSKAAAKLEIVRGDIVSMDKYNNQVTIKNPTTGKDETFSVNPNALASLKIGERVKITYDPGTTKARTIVAIKKRVGKYTAK